MILTDREILSAINNKQISIKPVPRPEAFSSTSIDLSLSKVLRIWNPAPPRGVDQTVCPADEGYKFNEFVKQFTTQEKIGNNGFVITPQMFLLAWTSEEIDLPSYSRLAARVEGKSSLARLGIGIHITAPTIHAGFSGPIQLEICNHGTLNVRMRAGMPVCQLIFEQTLGTPAKGYGGQFFNQKKA